MPVGIDLHEIELLQKEAQLVAARERSTGPCNFGLPRLR